MNDRSHNAPGSIERLDHDDWPAATHVGAMNLMGGVCSQVAVRWSSVTSHRMLKLVEWSSVRSVQNDRAALRVDVGARSSGDPVFTETM